MYCLKCGTQLPPDSQFCTSCGAKVDNELQLNVGPIAPPLMDQPYGYGGQQSAQKKKSKALLWVLIGVGAALIVAAVLFFVVFAPGGGIGPFSGNTVQTRFANDAVGVFTGAFDGLSSKNQTSETVDKPFELDMNMSMNFSGIQSDAKMSAAYDEKAFGMNITSTSDLSNSEFGAFFGDDMAPTESTMKLLLLEDVLYTEQDGVTEGVKFDTDADLSKPLSLKERIAALLDSGDNNGIDYLKLTEMFLNSIDEGDFKKSADKATLTLDADALADTLDVFADNLADDKELNQALSDMIEESAGYAYDISDIISLAAPMLSQSDFEMVWTVFYDGGKPKSMQIAFEEAGSMVFDFTFSYENDGDGRTINLEVATASGETVTAEFLLTKTAKGLEFEGAVKVPGADEITINGQQEISGSDISGSLSVQSAGSELASMNYEGTISIGMPKEAVEDDSRFEVNTKDAVITDFDQSFGSGLGEDFTSMPSFGMMN